MALDNTEITEQLFEAIDTIVQERLRKLPYDKTVLATILNNNEKNKGKYTVTTDNNITFDVYSNNTNYDINDIVYVRIPQGDYSQRKVIANDFSIQNKKIFYEEELQSIISQIVAQNSNDEDIQNQWQAIQQHEEALETLQNQIEQLQEHETTIVIEDQNNEENITSFISSISQDNDGKIIATKADLNIENKQAKLNYGQTTTVATIGDTNITVEMPEASNSGESITVENKQAKLNYGQTTTIATIDNTNITVEMPEALNAEGDIIVENKQAKLNYGQTTTIATIGDTNITVEMPEASSVENITVENKQAKLNYGQTTTIATIDNTNITVEMPEAPDVNGNETSLTIDNKQATLKSGEQVTLATINNTDITVTAPEFYATIDVLHPPKFITDRGGTALNNNGIEDCSQKLQKIIDIITTNAKQAHQLISAPYQYPTNSTYALGARIYFPEGRYVFQNTVQVNWRWFIF